MSKKFLSAFDFVYWTRPFYTPRGTTQGDFGHTDLATDEDITVFVSERLLLDEAGLVIGMTAVINGQELTLKVANSRKGILFDPFS